MANQTNANITVAMRKETTAGVLATATGSYLVRLIPSQGLELKRSVVNSLEMRDDAEEALGRLGSKIVDGSYAKELTVGGDTDVFLEALSRAAWATATTVALTSCAFTTNAITQVAGDFVGTSGLRVGDIFTITGAGTSAVNNLRTPIIAIGSLTLTVPSGTFVTCTVTGTLTRLKKLSTATTPTRSTWSFEQFEEDIVQSERFFGCRIIGGKFSLRPDGMAQATFNIMGVDRSTGASQYFTTPTTTTGLPLVAADCQLYKSGVAVTTFTGLEFDFTINAQGVMVIGQLAAADVIDNIMRRSGTITGLRSDFSALTEFDAETEFSLGVILLEPGTAPRGCLGLYIPRVKIGAITAPVGGGDGAKIVTRTLLIGPQVASTGNDATAANWFSSGSYVTFA